MLYLIQAKDSDGVMELRTQLRAAHVEYWQQQGERVKLGSPSLAEDRIDAAPNGSVFVVEAASADEARRMLEQDPFAAGGVFNRDFAVTPLRVSLGAWKDV